MTTHTHPNYAARITAVLAGWLAVVMAAAARSLFSTAAGATALPLGAAAAGLVVVFLAWAATSPPFRQFVLAQNPRILTLVQAWRAAGFLFLVLATYGILPRQFALPAGWGDIAIGVTAPIIALYFATPAHRTIFVSWHILGMLDLIMAVSLGIVAPIFGYGSQMGPMTVLPLSIVPTFIVPVLAILHIVCLAQAAGWSSAREARPERREAIA